MFMFGLFRSVKVAAFMFLFWYLFIIIAIILDVTTANIGFELPVSNCVFVDFLIKLILN